MGVAPTRSWQDTQGDKLTRSPAQLQKELSLADAALSPSPAEDSPTPPRDPPNPDGGAEAMFTNEQSQVCVPAPLPPQQRR